MAVFKTSIRLHFQLANYFNSTVTEMNSFWRRSLYCSCQNMRPKHCSWEMALLRFVQYVGKWANLGFLRQYYWILNFFYFTPYRLAFTDVSEKHNVYQTETSVDIHRLIPRNIQDKSIKIFIMCTNNVQIVCISCVQTVCTNCIQIVGMNYVRTVCVKCVQLRTNCVQNLLRFR
jgi:hypothetical protein